MLAESLLRNGLLALTADRERCDCIGPRAWLAEQGMVPEGSADAQLRSYAYKIMTINDIGYREQGVWRLVSGRTIANPAKLYSWSHVNMADTCLELSAREIVGREGAQAMASIVGFRRMRPFSKVKVSHAGAGLPLEYDVSLSALCIQAQGVIACSQRARESASLRAHRSSITLQLGVLMMDQNAFRQRWNRLGKHLVAVTPNTTPMARSTT
eukprot:3342104-Amphidinium_carterae.1